MVHRSIQARGSKNQIRRIKLADGQVIEDEEGIRSEAEKYFMEILAPTTIQSLENLQWQPDMTLSEGEKSILVREVDDEEIKNVIWNSKEGTAPDPDGFSISFFKSAWEVVGKEVIAAIKHFFHTGKLLRETNATFITLIPKVLKADSFKDYKPISLCNLLYKFVTKILANRLKCVVRSLIRPNQTAFIEGRSIVENILVCLEVVKGFERSNHSPAVIMKINL